VPEIDGQGELAQADKVWTEKTVKRTDKLSLSLSLSLAHNHLSLKSLQALMKLRLPPLFSDSRVPFLARHTGDHTVFRVGLRFTVWRKKEDLLGR